jgi:5-enolpyruvylshikimate-3-phosphate synthase
MTSEGLERSTVTRETSVAAKWTEEEIETIFSAVARFRGRPLLRACLFLEENGIRITQTQLKKFL